MVVAARAHEVRRYTEEKAIRRRKWNVGSVMKEGGGASDGWRRFHLAATAGRVVS